MRLYLSSFRLGDHAHELVRLVNKSGARAGIINNAADNSPPDKRAEALAREMAAMQSLGFTAEEIDLRDYFGRGGDLAAHLAGFDLLWVRGGNAFLLNRAIRASGFDAALKPLLAADKIVYAGYSAGVCAAAPDLRGIELCDDPHTVPAGYDSAILWEGMGLIPYSVAPHYRSDHPEAPMIENVVTFLQKNNIPFRTLQDGDVIVIDGGQEKLLKRNPPAMQLKP